MEETTPTHTPSRVNLADLVLTGVLVAQGVATAMADGLEYLGAVLASHSLHTSEKQQFKTTAGRDIEAMTRDNG